MSPDLPRDTVDAVIVGGGAAGIAAAAYLLARQRSVLVVEALGALGGRARTAMVEGMALDLGCGWLHSADRNPLALLAGAQGLTINREPSAWETQLDDLGFAPGEWQAARDSFEALSRSLRDAPPASDRAADARGIKPEWRLFLDAVSSFVNGVALDSLSSQDFLAYDRAATEENWRLESGLGHFVVSLARGVPALTGTKVHAIDEVGDGLSISTERGALRARSAIVTVSTSVLARGAIQLPSAALDHLHAASVLPLGNAEKVYLALPAKHDLPPESHLHGSRDRADTGSYYIRPFGRPVIEGFFGGTLARELAGGGEKAFSAFATEELGRLLGSRLPAGMRVLAASSWAVEPTIGGSYSHALPGHAAARRVLARPISERLCLAGEACSPSDFSTAHGAWSSGEVAAVFIHAQLPQRGPRAW